MPSQKVLQLVWMQLHKSIQTITDPAIAYPASGTTEDQDQQAITQKMGSDVMELRMMKHMD
ncbi:MAG: hypothetical protein U0X76_01575 [Bacteroidia bacterium]